MVWQDLGFQPSRQEKSRLPNTGHLSMYDMATMSGLAFWKKNVRSEAVWCSMVLRYLQHPGESHGDSDSVGLAWARDTSTTERCPVFQVVLTCWSMDHLPNSKCAMERAWAVESGRRGSQIQLSRFLIEWLQTSYWITLNLFSHLEKWFYLSCRIVVRITGEKVCL